MAERILDDGTNVLTGTPMVGEADAMVARVAGMTVAEVLAAVAAGDLGREEALRAEQAGRNRVTVTRALQTSV